MDVVDALVEGDVIERVEIRAAHRVPQELGAGQYL